MPTPSRTMMIARLLIAGRRPSVVHITTREPRSESRQNLVRRKARARRYIGDAQLVVTIGADERRDIADLTRDVRNVDHRHVHRHETHDARPTSVHEHRSNVAQRTPITV